VQHLPLYGTLEITKEKETMTTTTNPGHAKLLAPTY
jgi:hypothetical protein